MARRRFRLAVMSVAVIGSLQHVAGQGRGVPGSMAFFSAREGNNEIYVMDWDGRRPLRLTSDPASDVDPDISPNGRDVVFTSNRTGNNDIHIMDRTGRNQVNLTNTAANAWMKIAARTRRGCQAKIQPQCGYAAPLHSCKYRWLRAPATKISIVG